MKWLLWVFLSFLCLGFPKETSLQEVSFEFQEDNGNKFTFNKIVNKDAVVAFAYTTCEYACPLIVDKMRKIEKKLHTKKQNAEFVMISFDPLNDTVDVLKKYKIKSELNRDNWHFLTGEEKVIQKTLMIFGVKAKKIPSTGVIDHDNKIFIFGRDGKLKKVLEGLDASIDDV